LYTLIECCLRSEYPGLVWLQAYPQEKVGVFVRRGKGGPLTVVEYSELDSSLASAINQETGRLRFCWSNVMSVATLIDLVLLVYNTILLVDLHFVFLLS
jgi:UDP-N-acetylglucosamine pyrophosphorylase